MSGKDLYEILGVSRTATADEIKRAYRKLAKQHHPDQNRNDSSAEQKFKEIQHAYSILHDKDKRARYDQFGEVGAGDFHTGRGGEQVYSWGTGGQSINAEDLEDLFRGFGGMGGGGGGGGIFDQFFGGGRRTARPRRESPVRGRDVQQKVNLAFADAVCGTTVEVDVRSGIGRSQTLTVKIPPGVEEGQQIRLKGKGHPGMNGGANGDLFLICGIRPHKFFRREGADIYLDLPLTITEALLGTKVDVPTLDGTVSLTIPPGTSGGSKLRLKGRGVPAHQARSVGDQYVVVRIQVPKKLNEQQTEALKTLESAYTDEPRKLFDGYENG